MIKVDEWNTNDFSFFVYVMRLFSLSAKHIVHTRNAFILKVIYF